MNKVILMGRLVKDPEVRYSNSAEPLAVARYTLAVNRRFKRQGEPEADFINCVAFGKNGELAEKYIKKGQMIGIVGRLQVRSWDEQEGKKHWSTDVVVEEQYFAESKSAYEAHRNAVPQAAEKDMPIFKNTTSASDNGFYPMDESVEDDDLPF